VRPADIVVSVLTPSVLELQGHDAILGAAELKVYAALGFRLRHRGASVILSAPMYIMASSSRNRADGALRSARNQWVIRVCLTLYEASSLPLPSHDRMAESTLALWRTPLNTS
jgi:hypothetical protein